MTAPNLSVASATVPDINDKLNVIAGRIQKLNAQGNLDQPVFSGDYGVGGSQGLVPAPAAGDAAAVKYLKADGTWAAVPASGDVSGPAASVDSEVALFSGITGKLIKRASATGIAKLTAGVLSTVTAPSGAIVGDIDAQTITNKTISLASNTLTATSAQLATAISDETGTGALVFGTSPTIVTPTIASFANATHTHQNAAGGGTLDTAAIASGTLAAARMPALTGDVTTSAGAVATTLATVNANVGTFGSATQVATPTVNAKGLITAISNTAISLAASAISSGLLALARGGTNADLSATGGASQVLKQTSAGAAVTVGQLAASDLSNGVTGSGAAVLANTPTLITPVIGAATGTSLALSGGYRSNSRTVNDGEWVTTATPTMSADAGTVTIDAGDITRFAYTIIGKTMELRFWLSSISVSAGTGNLYIIVPAGLFSASTNDTGVLWYSDNGGAYAQGTIRTYGAGSHLMLYKNLGPSSTVNWSISTNNTTIYGAVSFPIQ